MVKGNKQAQGPRDLPSLTLGTTETPPEIPLLPRDKDLASWNPCLAVGMGHNKHAQDPQDPPNCTHGTVTMTVAHSPDGSHLLARHIPHGPSPPTQPPNAYPPDANTAVPRPLCQIRVKPGPSLPNIILHEVNAILPGLHTPDKATYTGSLLSREGNPAY